MSSMEDPEMAFRRIGMKERGWIILDNPSAIIDTLKIIEGSRAMFLFEQGITDGSHLREGRWFGFRTMNCLLSLRSTLVQRWIPSLSPRKNWLKQYTPPRKRQKLHLFSKPYFPKKVRRSLRYLQRSRSCFKE